jgi:hypothetical protein
MVVDNQMVVGYKLPPNYSQKWREMVITQDLAGALCYSRSRFRQFID